MTAALLLSAGLTQVHLAVHELLRDTRSTDVRIQTKQSFVIYSSAPLVAATSAHTNAVRVDLLHLKRYIDLTQYNKPCLV